VANGGSSGLDGFFANTNIIILVLFGVCCSGIALILGIIGLVTCTDPLAKRNALIVTILGALFGGGYTVMALAGNMFGALTGVLGSLWWAKERNPTRGASGWAARRKDGSGA